MKVSAQQARDVMRRLEEKLKSNFSLLEWVRVSGDKKHLVHRISFIAHPIRVELHEIVPAQQYAIVIVLVAIAPADQKANSATDEVVRLAVRKVWMMGGASNPRKARGFCPANLSVFADSTHSCLRCNGVERVTRDPQEGEDFAERMVQSVLPPLKGVLSQY